MSAATAPGISLLSSNQTAWRILREGPHYVLLEAAIAATEGVLLLVLPNVREPIVWNRPNAKGDLPGNPSGTADSGLAEVSTAR